MVQSGGTGRGSEGRQRQQEQCIILLGRGGSEVRIGRRGQVKVAKGSHGPCPAVAEEEGKRVMMA